MRLLLTLLLCLVGLDLQAQALWRNFFTTNQTPIVDVVAGSNATVVATTPSANVRRFTVSSTATGGGTSTNVYGTNVIGAVAEATHATNADSAVYVTTPILTNAITNFTITSAMVTNVLPAVLTNNTTGNAGSATFVLTSVLTNGMYASNVVSGGQLPVGVVATNTAFLTNAFLKEDGVNRYWSFDGGSLTNVPFSIFTNYALAPASFTNVNGLAFGTGMYGMTSYWAYATVAGVGPIAIRFNGVDTNTVISTNGGVFYGSILSLAPSAVSPSSNELVTASWVRSIFNSGAAYYTTANVDPAATNAGSGQQVYTFQSTIPSPFIRSYATTDFLTNGGYVGAVITTNTFPAMAGAITVNAYLGFTGGSSTPTLTAHPEIYYSYDKVTWLGDYAAGNQSIVYGTTNLYQWTIDFPAYTATNASGFYIMRRMKVGTVTGAGTRTLTLLGGTNTISGPNDASHITMQSPSAMAGNAYLANNQTFTGTNTFTGGGGNVSISGGAVVASTTLQGTNVTLTATLVANLGTPAANTYPMRYASDVITSRGTGGFVQWDGTYWKTLENVVATTSLTNFVINAWASYLYCDSPISVIRSTREPTVGTGANDWRVNVNSSGDFWVLPAAAVSWAYFETSTGSTSYRGANGYFVSLTSGDVLSSAGRYYHGNAASAAEQFYTVIGFNSSVTANPATGSGVYFIYDMFTNSVPADGTARTNNWICAIVKAGSAVYYDSGLTPSTSATTPDRLMVLLSPGSSVTFYTNGVACLTYDTAANLPTANLYQALIRINKTVGTTNRRLYETSPYAHIRRVTSITPP